MRASKVLVCRKRAGLSNAGLWEFPGGKCKHDESLEQALVRELEEELQVKTTINHLQGKSLGCSQYASDELTIDLCCYIVSEWQGEFALTDHDKIRWCSVSELRSVALSDADVPFIDRIESYMA